MADESLAVIAAHLRPSRGFGGVAESTAELIRAWRGAGRKVTVAVSDGTLGSPLSDQAIEAELLGPAQVYHATWAVRWGFGLAAPLAIVRAIRPATRVYISGIATWPATLGALIATAYRRPYVVALRGGLMSEHWEVIARTRPLKRLFYQLLVFPALRGAAAVHAASDLEAESAAAVVSGLRTFVAPNAFASATAPQDPAPPAGQGLRLLYLGRLSKEKGILGFAKAFAQACGAYDQLSIAGPSVGAYGEAVVRFCEETPGCAYVGVLERSQIAAAMSGSHAVVLPSGVDGDIRENFGNVVVEALLNGRPVLVTRGLAWDGLEPAGVGVLLDRSLGNLGQSLSEILAWAEDGAVWSRCVDYARREFSVAAVADRTWLNIFGRFSEPDTWRSQ